MAQTVRDPKPEVDRRRAAAERLRGMLGRDPSRSFTDELIAERRAATALEAQVESLQPIPDEMADHYAGKWVVTRAREVVRSADTYDELMEDGELDDGDLLAVIPPTPNAFY